MCVFVIKNLINCGILGVYWLRKIVKLSQCYFWSSPHSCMCYWRVFWLDFYSSLRAGGFLSLSLKVTCWHYISGKIFSTEIWTFFLSLSYMFLRHLGHFSVENIFWNISNFWDQIFENKTHRVVGLHILYDPQVPNCKNILCCGWYWARHWACFLIT